MKKELNRILLMWLMFAAFIVFSCCTPQQRLSRLVKNHPELVKVDTIKITDTTFIPGHYTDTIVSLLQSKTDTIVLTKNNIITKVFTHRDSIFISQTALSDTIIKTISIPDKQVIVEPMRTYFDRFFDSPFVRAAWLLMFILLVLLISRKK